MLESNDDATPPDDQELPSRSELKRATEDLQKIGENLIKLSDAELAKIPLPSILRDAIILAKALKAREAIRRHKQYIGKIMREVDVEPIILALKKIQFGATLDNRQFHLVEDWRDKLIAGGDAVLQDFINHYENADRQLIRQLVRNAKQDALKGNNTGGSLKLFKYLRELLAV